MCLIIYKRRMTENVKYIYIFKFYRSICKLIYSISQYIVYTTIHIHISKLCRFSHRNSHKLYQIRIILYVLLKPICLLLFITLFDTIYLYMLTILFHTLACGSTHF